MSRDDFKLAVARLLARRAGHRCSNPDCRRDTSGPASIAESAINIGVAAHITAASEGGPRFDVNLTAAQRSAIANGIWLCQWCGKLVDSDEAHYTRELLGNWKISAEYQATLRLKTPARPQDGNEPILTLPSTDAAVSWLPFSARATTMVGRDIELARLKAFIESNRNFEWLLVTGAAGAGKSRLALELCHTIAPKWAAGFLSRTDRFRQWPYFRPSRPTLIVIDYASGRAADAGSLVLDLARSAYHLPLRVRVLLLEREQGSWWPRFLRAESQTESEEILSCQYSEPLSLRKLPLEKLQTLASEVARRQHLPWNDGTSRAFSRRVRTLDPLGRPLFGMLIAAYPENGDALNQNLLSGVMNREAARRRAVIPDSQACAKMENLATLAALVGGLLPRADEGFAFLKATDIAALIADADLVDPGDYRDFVAATSSDIMLAGFQPDVLGERLVLDRLSIASALQGVTRRLLFAAWGLEPDDLCNFILRTIADFPADPAVDALCDLPLRSSEERARWGRLVGDIIQAMNRGDDHRTRDLLDRLGTLARSHPTEPELQNALARAQFNVANIFLFAEGNHERAAFWFDAAMGHVAPGTAIEASIRNNRGILNVEMQNEDQAFQEWSDVIANKTAPDEARACSLNNRADILAQRGLQNDAIADRSAVLALQETSPDRRYIALIRRSTSYCALGRIDDALLDLTDILGVADIAPAQKAEARLRRGVIYMDLGRYKDAEDDLQAVCSCEQLFPGTFASSLVALAELARRSGDAAASREFLDIATSSDDADEETVVEALIVWARALADQNAREDSERIWQIVLSNPNATERQRILAANRGLTPP